MKIARFAISVLAVFVSCFAIPLDARADNPSVEPIPVLPPAAQSAPSSNAAGVVPAFHRSTGALIAEEPAKKPAHPFLAHLLHPHSWCCGSDPYNPGCDSWEDECIFLFGSCREFYGEPCYKKSPPPPWGLYPIHP